MAVRRLLKALRDRRAEAALARLMPLPARAAREPITVSLTSTSQRVATVHRTIESILAQSLRPDRLVLWLSENPHLIDRGVSRQELGEPLLRLAQQGLEIRWTDNTGPYRKLVPALPEVKASGGVVITADDDVLYPESWLERLYRLHLQYPRAIVCYRGFYMKGFSEGRLTLSDKWKRDRGEEPSLDIFPTGKDGVLYPAGSLSDEIFNHEKYLQLACTGDDVWFKAMSLLNGTLVKNIATHKDFPIIKGSNVKTLYQTNRRHNDYMIREVFCEYRLVKPDDS